MKIQITTLDWETNKIEILTNIIMGTIALILAFTIHEVLPAIILLTIAFITGLTYNKEFTLTKGDKK